MQCFESIVEAPSRNYRIYTVGADLNKLNKSLYSFAKVNYHATMMEDLAQVAARVSPS